MTDRERLFFDKVPFFGIAWIPATLGSDSIQPKATITMTYVDMSIRERILWISQSTLPCLLQSARWLSLL